MAKRALSGQRSGRQRKLSPVRHEEPRCESFEDEATVRAHERAMRVHRAYTESFRVSTTSQRVDSTYRVESTKGAAYLVDIVDASAEHDACTCPDFLGNELGTCKHIEAVRRLIAGDRRLRAELTKIGPSPAISTVVVDARGELAVRTIGPRPSRTNRERREVHAAAKALDILRHRRELVERRKDLLCAREEGRLHLEMLREPLFPYQETGVLHLAASGRALLADDMGLGKTVQAIAACEVLRARGEVRRALIVAPATLKEQWAREIHRYTGVQPIVVDGPAAARNTALTSDAAYTITSYELTWRDLGALKNLQPDVLVLDEAQRAKNFRTKTAATLRALQSRFLFVLTGTPIENRLDDLYSLLQLVDPSALGPLWRFNHQFHRQNARGKVTGYKRLGELRSLIGPLVLRRRKEEVLAQLPPLTQQTRYIELSPAQAELEEHFRGQAAKLLATAERRALRIEEQRRLMAMLLKARQACNAAELCDPGRKESSPKLDELEQLVAEIVEQGADKILVFSEWTEMLRLVATRLERMGIGYDLLHGGVPVARRPALLDGFRNEIHKRVLLSTDAGGVGLNLQVASYVIHLDLPWNPGRLDQRTARAHRLGQTRGVSVIYLCGERGIERGIEGTLAGKRALRGAALDPTSETETLDAPSFSAFVSQMREVLSSSSTPSTPSTPDPISVEPAAAPPELAQSTSTTDRSVDTGTPRGRLRLASIVLAAGFPGDAVKAAYEGLARAARALLPRKAPEGHAALVAAIYRDLLPTGRVAPGFHTTLARLYDVSQLEAHGVTIDSSLATETLTEAAQWIDRLDGAPVSIPPPGDAKRASRASA